MTFTIRVGRSDDIEAVLGLWIRAGADPTHTDDAESLVALIDHPRVGPPGRRGISPAGGYRHRRLGRMARIGLPAGGGPHPPAPGTGGPAAGRRRVPSAGRGCGPPAGRGGGHRAAWPSASGRRRRGSDSTTGSASSRVRADPCRRPARCRGSAAPSFHRSGARSRGVRRSLIPQERLLALCGPCRPLTSPPRPVSRRTRGFATRLRSCPVPGHAGSAPSNPGRGSRDDSSGLSRGARHTPRGRRPPAAA